MARETDHIQLANRNEAALQFLLSSNGTSHPEWIATVAFYKALQLVDAAYRNRTGRSNHDHASRNRVVKKQPFPRALNRSYRALWAASTVARYLHDNTTDTDYSSFVDYMPDEQVVAELVQHRLHDVEQIVMQMLPEELRVTIDQTRVN
ncbi:MAG: hypothetical protein QGG36_09685 [Pirellulaceae bacterium]|jgi:hypothetical protein|nr:hypothetical protein [Pirellulaceae bacterium]